jgi:hypothetical protein
MRPDADGLPRLTLREDDSAHREALQALQRFVLKHPAAAQALFAAAAAEGRRYAATPQGAALQGRLRQSPWLHRARLAFEGSTGRLLSEEAEAAFPPGWFDATLRAVAAPDLEGLLAGLAHAR